MADDTKWCPRCEAERPVSEFYVNKGRADGLSGYCIPHQREAEDERRRALRTELLNLLGGRCAIAGCPNDDPRGWCVDHVKGGGKAERDSGVWTASRKFVERVRANPDDYQLLCAYHNQIKKVEEAEHVGRRVYERQVATERKQGIGRGNAPAQRDALAKHRTTEHQRKAAKASWGSLTPEQREARVAKQRAATTGRKLVTGPEGKRHWERPDTS